MARVNSMRPSGNLPAFSGLRWWLPFKSHGGVRVDFDKSGLVRLFYQNSVPITVKGIGQYA